MYFSESYESLMSAVLLSHYNRTNRPSYLDLVQQICMNLTDACVGVTHEGHDHDPLVSFNLKLKKYSQPMQAYIKIQSLYISKRMN